MPTAQEWIDALELAAHPEGGWFREVYRSAEVIPHAALPPRFGGARAFSTAIYFLLRAGEVSAWHRIASDEGWHHLDGDPLTLHLISPDGGYRAERVGRDPAAGVFPFAVAPAGWWFGASVERGFALVSCTVAPGFDFADFEMPGRAGMEAAHPALVERIRDLFRGT
ncbi:MAG: cupin domain-containing protein [Gemmataceae bacterium]